MKIKKVSSSSHLVSSIIISVSFFLGAIGMYFLITTTTIVSINYQQKFNQFYAQEKRERGWETYIDLVRGIAFTYPQNQYVEDGTYIPGIKQRNGEQGIGGILEITDHSLVLTPEYTSTVNLLGGKLQKKEGLLTYAKRMTFYLPTMNSYFHYSRLVINGKNAVVGELKIKGNIYEKLTSFGRDSAPNHVMPEDLYYKQVFIQDGDRVYIFRSGNLFSESKEEIFTNIYTSFKTLY